MNKKIFFLKMLSSSLLRRKSRMLIALLSVAIGSTILFGLITIYKDVPHQLGEEFRSYGANLIIAPQDKDFIEFNDFTKVAKILHTNKFESQKRDALVGIAKFKFNNIKINEQPFVIAATSFDDTLKTLPYWDVTGDIPKNKNEIILGNDVATKLSLNVNDNVQISTLSNGMESKVFKVSGILKTGDSQEDNIFIGFDGYKVLFDYDNSIDLMQCSIKAQKDELEGLANYINEKIPSVKANLVNRLVNSEGKVLGKLKSLVFIVTIVVLALTMVCVSTTMMAVVSERRLEIGLRKALGAKNKSIIYEFLGEALLLGLLGGLLGVILGYIFAIYVSLEVFSRSLILSPILVLITLIISTLVTLLASFLPVKSTTKVKPALVLKGE